MREGGFLVFMGILLLLVVIVVVIAVVSSVAGAADFMYRRNAKVIREGKS